MPPHVPKGYISKTETYPGLPISFPGEKEKQMNKFIILNSYPDDAKQAIDISKLTSFRERTEEDIVFVRICFENKTFIDVANTFDEIIKGIGLLNS
jgi:hypothetical protein